MLQQLGNERLHYSHTTGGKSIVFFLPDSGIMYIKPIPNRRVGNKGINKNSKYL